MLKGMVSFVLLTAVGVVLASGRALNGSSQDVVPQLRNNQCVSCHSRLTEPVSLSNRYFEWHSSAHNRRGTGCEKCHGGDASAKDKAIAHAGVLKKTQPGSRLHWKNLPETCNTCHQSVVSAFVGSRHYQHLKGSGLGPGCTACHEHMASQVPQTPIQTASLCAQCHATVNGLMPMNMEILDRAENFMHALNRANVAVVWAESLFSVAENRKLDLRVERLEVAAARGALREAKINWHAFDPDSSRRKADEAFNISLKLKDELQKKLGY